VRVWAFAHASRVREQSPGSAGIWQAFPHSGAGTETAAAAQPAHARAGEWCALNGVGDWAVANFNEARRLGQAVSPLALGTSYLDAGRTDDAREQFRAALRDNAAALTPEAAFHLALYEDAPSAEAVPASATTTRPSTRPASSGVPSRFTFMSPSHPAGRRNWSETSPGRWEERWPDGTARAYDFTARGQADGAAGTIVRWPGASNVQMFIPDAGEQLKYRSADTGPWKDWARMETIDTRADDIPWPRPAPTARTGG
jgi:hypothetical protein